MSIMISHVWEKKRSTQLREDNRPVDSQVNLSGILKLIPIKDKINLSLGTGLRVLINFLDLFALAGVGIIAVVITQLGSSSNSIPLVTIPIIGVVPISEKLTVSIAMVVATLFLVKSVSAVFLNDWIGIQIAKIESKQANTILSYVFGERLGIKSVVSISELQNILVISLNALFANFLTSSITLLAEFSLLIILLVGFFVISPIATLAMVCYLGAVVAGLNYFVARRVRKEAGIGYSAINSTLKSTRDFFSVFKEIRLEGNTEEWVSRIDDAKFEASRSAIRGLNLNGIPRYVIESALIIGVFGFMSVVLLYSSLASQALVIGIFLTGGLRLVASLLPLQAAINTYKHSQEVGLDAFRLLTTIGKSTPHETQPQLEILSNKQGLGIEVRQLSFAFNDKDRPILTDLSFSIESGSKFAIVGPSGSGKTTLFNLILGFEEPTHGNVKIGGLAPGELINSHPGIIGYVPQKPHLISATFSENITLSHTAEVGLSEISNAIQLAGLIDVQNRLEFGSKTFLEPDSSSLSGGEIQRLGLARALLRKPKILLLDEATSALDAETEESINQSLNSLRGKVTTIVIAHRLSTIQDADKILYLDHGVIQGIGTFTELTKQVPGFARAVKLMMLDDKG